MGRELTWQKTPKERKPPKKRKEGPTPKIYLRQDADLHDKDAWPRSVCVAPGRAGGPPSSVRGSDTQPAYLIRVRMTPDPPLPKKDMSRLTDDVGAFAGLHDLSQGNVKTNEGEF